MPKYTYEPLISPDEIRILSFQRVSNQGPGNKYSVSVKLTRVPLKTKPTYTAISYTWGDLTRNHAILVNECPTPVTENLVIALSHLESSCLEAGSYLWIDALCIDQANHEEKTHQVRLMKHIYQNAVQVIVWLGPSTFTQMDTAMDELEALGSQSVSKFSWDVEADDLTTDDKKLLRKLAWRHGKWEGAVAKAWLLLELPWFRRVWIQQELAVANTVVIACGSKRLLFDHLASALNVYRIWTSQVTRWMDITTINSTLSAAYRVFSAHMVFGVAAGDNYLIPEPIKRARRTVMNRVRYQSMPGGLPLRVLLLEAYRSDSPLESSDARDKIYALLGFASDIEELDIQPRYDISWQQLYTETAAKLIGQGYFDLITLCSWPSLSERETRTLPSWVPDFNHPLRKPYSGGFRKQVFRASDATKPDVVVDFTEPAASLHFSGVIVDSIQEVGQSLFIPEHYYPYPTALKNIQLFLEKSKIYPEQMKADAAWRIPIGDIEGKKNGNYCRVSSSTSFLQAFEQTLKRRDTYRDRIKSIRSFVYEDLVKKRSRPFLSQKGYVGICDLGGQAGDVICIPFGLNVPLLLRRTDEGIDDTYQLVGETYVHGIMDGEYLANNSASRRFKIV